MLGWNQELSKFMWNTQKSHWIQEQPGSHPYFARECQPGKVPAVGGVGARCDSLPPSASTSTWETATTDAFLQIHFWRANVFWQILDQAENSKSAPFLTQRGGRYTATSLNPQNKGGTAVERENSRWVDEADRPTTGKKMQGYLTDTLSQYIVGYASALMCSQIDFLPSMPLGLQVYNPPHCFSVQKRRSLAVQQ